jgi:hypothetical protein
MAKILFEFVLQRQSRHEELKERARLLLEKTRRESMERANSDAVDSSVDQQTKAQYSVCYSQLHTTL